MVKNFFIELIDIFKYAGRLFVETFKKQGLIIWGLVALQTILAIPLSYFYETKGFINLSIGFKILFVVALIICLSAFFFMFKNVFNIASVGFKKENITHKKALFALLIIGVLNCFPLLFFWIMFSLAKAFPAYTVAFKALLNIFSYLFYFALSLSLASIVKWSEDIPFVSIFKSLKVFLNKVGLVILVFAFYFITAKFLTFIACTIIYAFCLYYRILDGTLMDVIHRVVNLYSLYVIAGLYIGSQVKILGIENDQSENNITEEQ